MTTLIMNHVEQQTPIEGDHVTRGKEHEYRGQDIIHDGSQAWKYIISQNETGNASCFKSTTAPHVDTAYLWGSRTS